MSEENSNQKNKDIETLRRFVVRARIVKDHSLARNLEVLQVWSKAQIPMVVRIDKKSGKASYRVGPIPLLPTEQIESAAARTRPIFLASEDVHFKKAIKALKRVCGEDSQLNEHLDEKILPNFYAADPDHPSGRPKKAPDAGRPRSNKDLAGSWLYGELIHDDKVRREIGEPTDLQVRFEAAMRTVCEQVYIVVSFLKIIENLQEDGIVEIPEGAFTDPVTVTWSEIPAKPANIYMAPVDTPIMFDSEGNIEGDEWIKNPNKEEIFKDVEKPKNN